MVFLLVVCPRICAAQTAPPGCDPAAARAGLKFEPFAVRSWYQPLIAEVRGGQTQFYLWGQAKPFPYMPAADHITVWEVNVGKELPFVAWNRGLTNESLLDCRGWGFGFWVPANFHMIADAGEDSVPLLNLDFRIGVVAKAAKAVSRRDVISMKAQLGHESTHLGDEFVLRALAAYGDAFQRVNVSYEYIEVGVDWERFFGGARQHSLSLRASGLQALSFGGASGWYAPRTDAGVKIFPSTVNFEPAFGVEYLPHGTHGWRPFASYEGRLRTVYDYRKPSADTREDRQFTSSIVLGLRQQTWFNRGMPDVIVRGYYGVNPHGQLRTQSNFWMFAVGLMIRL